MKKFTITILCSFILLLGSSQEVKDQFTILKELGEGTKIQCYYDLREGDDGKKKASVGNPFTLKFINNKFEKLYGFYAIYAKETNQTPPKVSNEWYTPNHHTKPSFFYDESSINPGIPYGKATYYLIVGTVLYQISGKYNEIKPGGDYSFGRYYYHIDSPEEKAEAEGEKKAKFGSKFKEKLVGMADEKPLPADLNIDHRKAVDEYLEKMNQVQANTQLNAEEEQEALAILNDKLEKAGKAKKANEEWHAWMAANSGTDSGEDKVTINNVSDKIIKITSCGTGYDIYAGKSESYSCSCKITYAVKSGNMWKESGNIISNNNNCGKTVQIK